MQRNGGLVLMLVTRIVYMYIYMHGNLECTECDLIDSLPPCTRSFFLGADSFLLVITTKRLQFKVCHLAQSAQPAMSALW
jgi:hypothetical protein